MPGRSTKSGAPDHDLAGRRPRARLPGPATASKSRRRRAAPARARRARSGRSPHPAGARSPLGAGHQARGRQHRLGSSGARTKSVTRGLPVGQRARLVEHDRVTLCSRSSASALRNRMPFSAPLPVPTMIDVGVARPSAHGQAMISTATVLSRARLKAGCGPSSEPRNEGQARRSPGRPARSSRSRRRRGAGWAPCCPAPPATSRTIWARTVSRPTRVARNVNEPVVLSVPPITSSPAALADRHRFAGDHALVDVRAAVKDDAVDGDAFTRPDHERRRRDDLLDRDVDVRVAAANACRPRLQADQLLDRVRRVAARSRLEVAAEQDAA